MIITFDQLPEIRQKHGGQQIVFGGGVYDLIHQGHIDGLAFRRSLGDILVCGIVSDERARTRKRQPVRSEADRLRVINALADVDYAFIMPLPLVEESPTIQVIKALRPDVYVEHVGNANRWTDNDLEFINSLGTDFVVDTQPKSNSTTAILSQIKSRHGPN